MNFDYIIIGAGIAGLVLAERLAKINNANVLIIEQRNHIGGNCYDCYDENDILIHPYGPHIFHTDNNDVWQYLSQFTDWHHYEHKVSGMIDDKLVPIPFNLNTLYALIPQKKASMVEEKLNSMIGIGERLFITELMQSEDSDLKCLAKLIHDKIFLNYTIKQWGMKPEEISSEILSRVPVVIDRDDRYFLDRYQGLPKHGYTRMFKRMLEHPRVKILLNTTMKDVIEIDSETGNIDFMGSRFEGKLIYTGMIDDLFGFKFGELPYRAIIFDHETLKKEKFQNSAVVNYPNEHDFTRITEFKHMTGQKHHFTSILREYPCWYSNEAKDIPCYPVLSSENNKKLEKYKKLAEKFPNIITIGRLAEYKYYDMDDMVAKALEVFENRLRKQT